ncbi:hypothetical protein REPUB_Repub20aG0134700 [Reevesia pubescens]
MGRSPCCEKVGLKRGRWTAEEDEILINYIQTYGEGSWRSLPKNAGLLRCGKSCRLRWVNYLMADLKRGNITPQEEETIVKLHNALGNSFTKTIKETKPSDIDAIKTTAGDQCKRRGGRTSRSAMKRHKLTLISLGIPKTITPNEVFDHDPTAQGTQIQDSKDVTNLQPDDKEDPDSAIEGRRNLGMDGSCMYSNANIGMAPSSGEESSSTVVEMYGCSERETVEVLGPYEWLDNEIKRLTSILQTDHQGLNPSGNHGLSTTNGENGIQKGAKNDDQENESYGIWSSSNAEITDEKWQICNSSSSKGNNSGFDDQEWLDKWDSAAGFQCHDDNLSELWDDSDKVLCWLLDEAGNTQN